MEEPIDRRITDVGKEKEESADEHCNSRRA